MEYFEELNWQKASVKAKSKHKLYTIIVTKGQCYIRPETQLTSDFIHDIKTGRKKERDSDSIDVGADAKGCHSSSCAANPRIDGAPDTWDGSSACWNRKLYARLKRR